MWHQSLAVPGGVELGSGSQRAAICGVFQFTFWLISRIIFISCYTLAPTWDDTEVVRRWLMICPVRTGPDGWALEPTEAELNSIRIFLLQLNQATLRSKAATSENCYR